MVCKNCGSSLHSDFSYCPACGAKVIRNRLTIKNIWEDLSFQIFNLENTLLKTFRHLFSKPETVVDSYISGVRKRYMNPISYFAIAVTLSGLMFFVLRNVYGITLTGNTTTNPSGTSLDFIYDYQGIFSYFLMPVYASITWLLFLDKAKMNYTEHLVANAYATAQTSFLQILISLPLFGFFDIDYGLFSMLSLLFITAYLFFVFARIHKIGFFSALLRSLAYLVLLTASTIAIGVVIAMIFFTTGQLNIEDFVPKK
ncbi:MAG: DUF3667 domain-containing protein [Bacteroidota bacterium]